MNKQAEKWLKEWADMISQKAEKEDFWVETPFGKIKNPKFVPEQSDSDNEITLTIKYEEWKKLDKDEGEIN